jgi:hypothetical protein
MGKCHVELSATVNLGNFQSVKATVGFEEEYTGIVGDTKDDKFKLLLEVCSDKLDEAVLTEVNRIQQLTGKKGKSTKIED